MTEFTECPVCHVVGVENGHCYNTECALYELGAEVRRLQEALYWYDAMLMRVCDHMNELHAEIKEGRSKVGVSLSAWQRRRSVTEERLRER